MTSFSFIHTADLHLDSPFKGVSEMNRSISSELAEATFRTFSKIIDLCLEKEVDFLLIAGDVYDGVDRSLRAQLRFRDGLQRLSEADIKTYIVHGNHDPLDGWAASLEWPKNVYIFAGKEVAAVPVEKKGHDIARIYGISYQQRETKTNLVKKFPVLTQREKDLFAIGLLHCNIGAKTGHAPYAPCSLQDLRSRNLDYWALGHVHKKAIINAAEPLVIYPGNPQGLHPGEIGGRGCFLVNVDENGTPSAEFIDIAAVRWFEKEIAIDDMHIEQDLLTALDKCVQEVRQEAGGRPAIGRIFLTGRGDLHLTISRQNILNDILQNMRELEEGEKEFVWIESIRDESKLDVDREVLLQREDFIGDLVRLIEEIWTDTDKKDYWQALDPLFNASPTSRKFLTLPDADSMNDLIKKAEILCLDKLIGRDGL